MGKWRWQTDVLSGRLPLLLWAVYVLWLFVKAPFYVGQLGYTESGAPVAGADVYFNLQMIPCVLIVFLTSEIFAETFRPGAREYISTFPAGAGTVILRRYVRLYGILALSYVPLCLFAAGTINRGIEDFIFNFPEYSGFPEISVFPMLVQCLVAAAFYISLALILLLIFKSRYFPVILTIIYCFLEKGPLRRTFGDYALFYGINSPPKLYELFPENTVLMLILTVVFLALVTLFTAKRSGRRAPG